MVFCSESTSDPGLRTYTTTFRLNENPISEGGNWINGGIVGLDWPNIATTSGHAIGASEDGDPNAILTGAWAPDQMAEAVVFSVNPTTQYYQEVELHLRRKMSAHIATGYEVLFRCQKNSNGYCGIVRWNGGEGDFTILSAPPWGSQYGVANGDVVKATIVGNVINAYINNVLVATATDSTWAEGSPGIGFNFGCDDTYVDFGFSRFTAAELSSPIR